MRNENRYWQPSRYSLSESLKDEKLHFGFGRNSTLFYFYHIAVVYVHLHWYLRVSKRFCPLSNRLHVDMYWFVLINNVVDVVSASYSFFFLLLFNVFPIFFFVFILINLIVLARDDATLTVIWIWTLRDINRRITGLRRPAFSLLKRVSFFFIVFELRSYILPNSMKNSRKEARR